MPEPEVLHADGRSVELPGPPVHPLRRTIRYWLARALATLVIRSLLRVSVEGRGSLPDGPCLYCFSHQSWVDPFILMASLPMRPRLYFFGPKEEDMSKGGRNRLMSWVGNAVPYKPGKNDLLGATRRVKQVFDAGGSLAIAAEGRIHFGEGELLPLNEGAAFFAMRAGLPVVPVAINGTSWLGFGRRVRVRIGRPIQPVGRPTRETVTDLTATIWRDLHERVELERQLTVARYLRAATDMAAHLTSHLDLNAVTQTVVDQRQYRASKRGPDSETVRTADRHASDRRSGGVVAATGLSANPVEYRERLNEQSDDQIDAWAAELMRDVAIRRGVLKVIADFRKAAKLDEGSFERVFAAGGGPPASLGRDASGRVMVPAVALWALVAGIRSQVADGRERLIEYLVENFEDLVYV